MDERDNKAMNKEHKKKSWSDCIRHIDMLNFGYNKWNGFHFTLLGIEIEGEVKDFGGVLLGLHISTDIILIYILFIEIEFKLR